MDSFVAFDFVVSIRSEKEESEIDAQYQDEMVL